MEGQLSLFDGKISYEVFKEHCIHRGWLKAITDEKGKPQGTQWMCGYKAKCWADHVPCKECNCILLK